MAALFVRLPHFRSLIPYFYHEDELRNTRGTIGMFHDRTLDPRWELYPNLPFYINGAAYAAYFFYLTAGDCIKEHSMEPLLERSRSFGPESREIILISRGLSLGFGLLSIVAVYLLGREFLGGAWGLLAAAFYAFIPAHITLSGMAKVDMSLQFYISMAWLFQLRLIRTGRFSDYAAAGVFSALPLVTKLDYSLLIFIVFAMMFRAVVEDRRKILDVLDRRFLGALLVFGATALIASPFWLLDLQKNIDAVKWLYYMSSFLSFYHIDPHHWWLDRYYYNYLFITPFLLGWPLYFTSLVGLAESVKRERWKPGILLAVSLISFSYTYPSQAEGSYAYYLHLHFAPLLVVFAAGFISILWEKRVTILRVLASATVAFIIVVGFLRLDSYYSFSLANFDRIGPWAKENIPADSRVLLFSVYFPGEGLGIKDVERTWPQDLSPEMLSEKNPDYIILDTWTFGGFKKFYKDTTPVEKNLNSLLAGNLGYRIIKSVRTRFFADWFYMRLDPEHEVELIVLEREGGPRKGRTAP